MSVRTSVPNASPLTVSQASTISVHVGTEDLDRILETVAISVHTTDAGIVLSGINPTAFSDLHWTDLSVFAVLNFHTLWSIAGLSGPDSLLKGRQLRQTDKLERRLSSYWSWLATFRSYVNHKDENACGNTT
jgi:hypothetical protein|tara:strand:- start:639 stop:1034 length:396 start_codon:yes stop_codon:yes gene_type:complete